MTKIRTYATIILIILMFAGLIAIGFTQSGDLAPTDSYAKGGNSLRLVLESPASTLGLKVGDQMSVDLVADINNPGAAVSEVILQYDNSFFRGVALTESPELIAVNKSIDDATGTMTIDLAQVGGEGFYDGQKLAEIVFEMRANGSGNTEITIADGSSLGITDSGQADVLKKGGLDVLRVEFESTKGGGNPGKGNNK